LQSLLSPEPSKESQESAGATVDLVQVNVESQLTHGTDFPSNKSVGDNDSESSDEVNGIAVRNSNTTCVTLRTADNLFDIHGSEGDLHDKMEDSLGELNDYSADQFSLDEHCDFYLERQLSSSNNCTAVEFIYMFEAESWVRSSGTRSLPDLKKAMHSKYFELI
jgi:hypothetical protein